ncbi:hypothetical protein [Pleomorphovibrio marinus]|uniref:hypothetical protein n=1 Tax=Pleomorphovibrio marinus TaxID=2164132 RepID=UPI000E0C3EFF|nr:hypothetical protein [Pleomorphovibrio marinus]
MKTALLNQPYQWSSEGLIRKWMRWALFFFLMASLFGLAMRYFFIGDLPYFEYTHLLHAHSHIALLGWGYLLVTGCLVSLYVKNPTRTKTYKVLFTGSIVSTLGMMASFPVQGYGLYSITFSTLHLLFSYGFAYHFLKDLGSSKGKLDKTLIRFSIWWMLLSSLGLWAIAPIGAILGKLHPLYTLSVQWFLHFQFNGWFIYALLGMLVYLAQGRSMRIQVNPWVMVSLHLSLICTYALTVTWHLPTAGLLSINAIGVSLQFLAYISILYPVFKKLFPFSGLPIVYEEKILYAGLLFLGLKALIQLTLVFPDAAAASHEVRGFVIGFIHLIMLGAISFGVGGILLMRKILPSSMESRWGWTLLLAAFVFSELLLFTQGLMQWQQWGTLPNYHKLIFYASALFPVSLGLIGLGSLRATPSKSFSKLSPKTEKAVLVH